VVVVMGGVTPDADDAEVGPHGSAGHRSPHGITVETVLLGGRTRSMRAFTGIAERAGLVVVAAAPSSFRGFAVHLRRAGGS
jgi:hypothetical protein